MRRFMAAAALTALVSVGILAAAPATAATANPFTKTWSKVIPGEVGQSAPVAVQGTTDIAVGSTDGTLTVVNRTNGQIVSGWNRKATGATGISAPLSSGSGDRLGVATTSTRAGSPTWLNYNVATRGTGFTTGKCTTGADCNHLSGLAWTGGTAYTGGSDQSVRSIRGNGSQAWSYLSSDSTNTTPALAALTGYGVQAVFTDDQTPNAKMPRVVSGGHLRIFTTSGNELCNANVGTGPAKPGSFDSSAAIGSTSAGVPLIVFGTGKSGAQPGRLLAYDAACGKVWETGQLAGNTDGSPAIGTISGRPVVYEEVSRSGVPYLYIFDLTTGKQLAGAALHNTSGKACSGFVQGTSSSVVTLSKAGHEYVFAPAGGCGVEAYVDYGVSTSLADLGVSCAVQNTPVVTQDSAGSAGITIAGYQGKPGGGGEGCLSHYTFAGGSTSGQWAEFHHDPSLSGASATAYGARNVAIAGQNLASGQKLTSPNGAYTLTVLANGQLQLKNGTKVEWTLGPVAAGAYLHVSTGTFEMIKSGKPTWQSGGRQTGKLPVLELGNSGHVDLLANPGDEWSQPTCLWAKAP